MKILYFFPLNLMKKNAGNVTRAWAFLDYFKERNFQIDYVYSADFWGTGLLSAEECHDLKEISAVDNIVALHKKPKGVFSLDYWHYKCSKLFYKWFRKKLLPRFVTPFNRKTFDKLLQTNKYECIIISYVYWADLIRNNKYIGDAKLIIDTHDFITSQEQKDINIGLAFNDEIDRLNLFHEVWAVSVEEEYLFAQFCRNQIRYVPITLEDKSDKVYCKEYDLIYVAGDNPHNIRSAKWFFDEVYSKSPISMTICVIGKINTWVPNGKNIIKIPYAEDLSQYYTRAKIAVCPMLTGTGVKVKVIEALSYGIPVVCTRRGVDGLVNKVDNGCFVADGKYDFLEYILLLLNNSQRYFKKVDEAKAYFKENHNKEVISGVFDKVFQSFNENT